MINFIWCFSMETVPVLYPVYSVFTIFFHLSWNFSLSISHLQENGYKLLFLSARSISQAYITRQFLLNLKQVMHKMRNLFSISTMCYRAREWKCENKYNLIYLFILQDGKVLPEGPVVISPDGLFPSLYREGNKSYYLRFLLLFTVLFLLY